MVSDLSLHQNNSITDKYKHLNNNYYIQLTHVIDLQQTLFHDYCISRSFGARNIRITAYILDWI